MEDSLTASVQERFAVKSKTWLELKDHVKSWQSRLNQSEGSSAHSFCFKRFGDGSGSDRLRCYCLGPPDKATKDHTLLYVDVGEGGAMPSIDILNWTPLFHSKNASSEGAALSKEEELLRERLRCITSGLTSFHHHEESGTVVFVSGRRIMKGIDALGLPTVITQAVNHGLIPEDPFRLPGAPIQPELCPGNPELLAFVMNDDIWLNYGNRSVQATFTKQTPEDPFSAGVPSFVIQEEFDRYSGFWWQPGRARPSDPDCHYLLFEFTDESSVPQVSITVPGMAKTGLELMRYPRSGQPNARSYLRMLRITVPSGSGLTSAGENNIDIEQFYLKIPLLHLFPWAEYLVRAGWLPNGSAVWAQLLSRLQNRLVLVHIPLEMFDCSVTGGNNEITCEGGRTAGKTSPSRRHGVTILLEEKVDLYSWINVGDHLTFIDHCPISNPTGIQASDSQETVSFIWSSSVPSGFRHLYLVSKCVPPNGGEGPVPAKDLCWRPLTVGEWDMAEGVAPWVDERRGWVYFVGSKDSPLEKHIYRTSLEGGPPSMVRVTALGYSYGAQRGGPTICLDPDNNYLLANYSSVKDVTKTTLFKIAQSPIPNSGVCSNSANSSESTLLSRICDLETQLFPLRVVEQVSKNVDAGVDDRMEVVQQGGAMFPIAPEGCGGLSGKGEEKLDNGPSQNIRVGNGSGGKPGLFAGVVSQQRMEVPTPELFSFRNPATGVEHHAIIFRPVNCVPGTVYPTILNVYGGPGVQIVRNANFDRSGYQKYSSLGYLSIWIDGRGSTNRGQAFEGCISRAFGTVEIQDQIDCFLALSAQLGVVDLSRVAIRGWSYGGYASLLAIIRRPDLFKVAIAGGPVTDWDLYDTGYTERYLGLPPAIVDDTPQIEGSKSTNNCIVDSESGSLTSVDPYRAGGLLDKVGDLPDEPGRVLLFHGMLDENVHFQHTARLVDAMINAGKPHQLVPFPRERHGVRAPAAFEFMETLVLHHLQNHL